MGFFTELERRAVQTGTLLCVGLDPHPADLPESTAQAAQDFCLRLIEATAEIALAFKPNSAFFEAYGPPGMAALQRVIQAVPTGVPVILDAKRGDIASTAEAYARAAFQFLGAQAITLSPYLGADSLEPFLADPRCGVFLLCKTSNPGAGDFQDLPVAGRGAIRRLYEQVAWQAQQWNHRDNLGLVVGATHPEALRLARAQAPDLWFLAPGVGAQGGDLRQALQAGLRRDGLGMIVPVSRSISRAADPRQAAKELRQAIEAERVRFSATATSAAPRLTPALAALAEGLLQAGCIQFGQFTLKSGLISPIYLDLRRLAGAPELLVQVATAYLDLLSRLDYDRLAALPYAALPIATAISLQSGRPLVYPRKEVKAYGTRAEVEGPFQPGERVVVIDDLATTGGSKFEGIERLQGAGLQVSDVVVLVDRQSGARQALEQAGYHLHAVFTLAQLLDEWALSGQVPAESINAARAFLKDTQEAG